MVRLAKGDYTQVTVYSDDPVEKVKEFEAAGAERVHIVDLDGARDGTPTNIERHFASIACQTHDRPWRSAAASAAMETLERYLDSGATRLVLGSTLVTNPEFAREAAKQRTPTASWPASTPKTAWSRSRGGARARARRRPTSSPSSRTSASTSSSTPTSRAMACRRASTRPPTGAWPRRRVSPSPRRVASPRSTTCARSGRCRCPASTASSPDAPSTRAPSAVEEGVRVCRQATEAKGE